MGHRRMNTIALDEILDISHVANSYQQMQGWLSTGGDYAIDGKRVEHVDSAGVQLLLAFTRAVRDTGGSIKWQGVSDKLQAAIERLGLVGELGLS